MGCVSSTLLNQDNEFTQMGSSAAGFSHHIVSLTSTTYGLLTLDPPSSPPPSTTTTTTTTTVPPTPTPPPRHTLGSLFPSPLSEPRTLKSHTSDIINSWELMAGLDSTSMTPISDSFRFSTLPKLSTPDSSFRFLKSFPNKENSSPNIPSFNDVVDKADIFKPTRLMSCDSMLDGFEKLCPPNGEDKIVIYTTTLRGVRRTFEACNAVRSAIEGLGVLYSERDISMDRGFRDELKELMKGKESTELIPPRVFFRGRYVGGVEEVMRIVEEGNLGDLLQGLPKVKAGFVCEGCGGVRFLPCFACNGSCKMVMVVKEDMEQKEGKTLVVKCTECNENGLVLCPICC